MGRKMMRMHKGLETRAPGSVGKLLETLAVEWLKCPSLSFSLSKLDN